MPDQGKIRHITYADLDVHGVQKKRAYFYIIPDMTDDIILGDVWMKEFDAVYSPKKGCMDLTSLEGETIRCWNRAYPSLGPQGIKPSRSKGWKRRSSWTTAKPPPLFQPPPRWLISRSPSGRRRKSTRRRSCPPQYREWLRVFDRQLADKLPMHRPGVDHKIVLKKDKEGNEAAPPWGPLYGMNREELLLLRKTPTELLGKNFIRASRSSAAAPVLFAHKPGGGARFCIDYRDQRAVRKRQVPPPADQRDAPEHVCRPLVH